MPRRLLFLALGAAAAAAIVASRRRLPFASVTGDGSRGERREELRRRIEEARDRLRADVEGAREEQQ